MNRFTQATLVLCGVVTAVSVAFLAYNEVPERDTRTNTERLADLNEALDAHFANTDRPFCKHIREEVAAGRVTATPGSPAADCLR